MGDNHVHRSHIRPRVLMVSQRYFPYMGGVETHMYEVANRLAQQGMDVTVLSTDVSKKLPRQENVNGVNILRVAAYPADRDYYFAPGIASAIRDGADRWDVIHCQGYHTFVPPMAMLAALQARIPFLVSFHSGGHSSSLRNAGRGVQRALLRPLLARAQRLVAVSQFEARQFQTWLRLPESRFLVIQNGSSLPHVDVETTPRSQGPRIVSVGRLERYKGHHRVIAAMPEVLQRHQHATLRIIGSGAYEQDLRDLTQRLNLTEHVHIGPIEPGDRSGMARALAQADLVTLLSEYEAHPIAVMEALSLRRPVVVTRTSGLEELANRGFVRDIPLDSSATQVANAITHELAHPLVPPPIALPTWDDCAGALRQLYEQIYSRARSGQVVAAL